MTKQKKPLNILALEPYYDGSHKAFLDEWIKRSVHHWTLMTLPGYTWKWRMRQRERLACFCLLVIKQGRPASTGTNLCKDTTDFLRRGKYAETRLGGKMNAIETDSREPIRVLYLRSSILDHSSYIPLL